MTPQVIFLEDISVTNFSLSDKYSDNEKIVTNISVTRPCATGILTWMKFGRRFKKATKAQQNVRFYQVLNQLIQLLISASHLKNIEAANADISNAPLQKEF